MINFPNAKINLGLYVVGKRDDGYHNIETIFYPLSLCDALEMVAAPQTTTAISLTVSGISIQGASENNLCSKAFQLLKKDFPQLPNISVYLHKHIPAGAGLGGGSADAAFTLKLLNEKFQLNISEKRLMEYALQLGSDCPFFIINKPCVAMGRGEILKEINVGWGNYFIVLIHPKIHVNTGSAFSKIVPKQIHFSLEEILQQPVEDWKNILKNDFEEIVFSEHPAIKILKDKLYAQGASYASMSGSGSSVYGIFKENPKDIKFDFPKEYFVFQSRL